jgi:hypothetical protein
MFGKYERKSPIIKFRFLCRSLIFCINFFFEIINGAEALNSFEIIGFDLLIVVKSIKFGKLTFFRYQLNPFFW